MRRLRTQGSVVLLALSQIDNSNQTETILFQNVRSFHLHINDVRSDYNIKKKLMSTFLLNQNFACQIEMIHIGFVNLRFTEMTVVSLTEGVAMELLCTLRMI